MSLKGNFRSYVVGIWSLLFLGWPMTSLASCPALWSDGQRSWFSPIRVAQQKFIGIPAEFDKYNPSGKFMTVQGPAMAVRAEPRKSEHSTVYLVRESGPDTWTAIDGIPPIPDLQDPFYFEIGERLFLGGVKVIWNETNTRSIYYTEFFEIIGRDLRNIEPFAKGPRGMKDVRLGLRKKDRRIALLTRPQNGDPKLGGRGKVGGTVIDDIQQLKDRSHIVGAPIYHNLWVSDSQWGGGNKIIFSSKSGAELVLGHLAFFGSKPPGAEKEYRTYYPILFVADPSRSPEQAIIPLIEPGGAKRNFIILARRHELDSTIEAKRPDLGDVIFSSDLVANADGTLTFMGGLGDAAVIEAIGILDPELVRANPILQEWLEAAKSNGH